MTNEELIKALKACQRGACKDCPRNILPDCDSNLYNAAADAIEAADKRIAELEAQMPKDGEWIELTDRAERKYSHICSNCHRFNIHEGEIEFYNYCPNCGAKMDCADGERR